MTYSFSSLNRSRYLAMAGIVLVVLTGLFFVWNFVIPGLSDNLSKAGEEALLRGDYDDAITLLERAVEQSDSNPRIVAQLLQAYASKGNATGTEQAMYEKAHPLAKQAAEEYPDNVDVLLAIGYLAETAGYYQEASEYYTKAVILDFENAQTILRLAHVLEFITDDPAATEPLYQRAYELEPENPHVMLAIGSLLMEEGTPDSIQRAYAFFLGASQRTEQVSLQAEALTNASTISLAQGNILDARNLAARAVNTDRKYAPALTLYGRVLAYDGKTTEALGYIDEAMQANPRYSEAYHAAGVVLRSVGSFAQSIEYFQDGLVKVDTDNTILGPAELSRTKGRFYYDIAKTYDMAGNSEASISALEQAVSADSSVAARARMDFEKYNSFDGLVDDDRFTSLIAE